MPRQVFNVPFAGRPLSIGQGYNSRSSEFVGTALKMGSVGPNKSAPGQTVAYTADIIDDSAALMKSLDMGASIEGHYGMANGSAKANFAEKTNYNSQCHIVVCSCVVQNSWTLGQEPGVPPGSAAERLVNSHRMDEFMTAYGDYYVRSILTGGEFYAVARITSLDLSVEQSLAIELHAAVNGGLAGGSFDGHYNSESQHTEKHTEVSINAYMASGTGVTNQLSMDVSSLMQYLHDFPKIAGDSPVGYLAEVAAYNTVPVDITPQVEIENLRLAIADAQQKRLDWLTIKNDMEFARERPYYFTDLPADSDLKHVADAYTRALNLVMAHLTRLASGEISPAQLFDTTTVDLPEVPELRRAVFVQTMVTLPDFAKIPRPGDDGDGSGPITKADTLGIYVSQLVAAEAEVERLGLTYTLDNRSGTDPLFLMQSGSVAGQYPAPGTKVTVGTSVVLQV